MGRSILTPADVRALLRMEPEERMAWLRKMSPADLIVFDATYELWAHKAQLPPRGQGWRTWLMMAGRGFGKTRAGAEWITGLATQPRRPVRIALVGATAADVRAVMIEGESGLLAVAPRRLRPRWEPSLGRLTWPGGSVAQVFSAEAPEQLRGPAHHYAWCDELAKWSNAEAAWHNLQMGLRCGERPRALVTTTPRPIPLLKTIAAEPWTVTTRGRTDENAHLPEEFVRVMVATYGGTRLGRQELDGALIEDVEGALWTRETMERCRVILPELCSGRGTAGTAVEGPLRQASGLPPPRGKLGEDFLKRVVIGVDPPASAGGDACGIVACGVDAEGTGYVLGDHSVRGLAPEGWARAVVAAAEAHEADLVVVENNQGGDMVESVLRSADFALPVRPVRARFGKGKRAEPVATLFARGKAKLAGTFPELEDELAGLTSGGGYEGPGRSPDRADAMVWALTELMLGKPRAEPRIMVL